MRAIDATATRYDGGTIWLHWITVVLVVEQWIGAQVIDLFARGGPRVDARSVHIVLGAALVLLLVARICWRLSGGRRLPQADGWPLSLLARAAQLGLYGLLVVMVGLGLSLAWVRGDSIFGLFSLPSFAPGDKALSESVQDAHAAVGWAILALGGLHGAAALVHRYLWRDGVLARMWP